MLMLIVFTTTAQSQGVFSDNGSWYRKYHSIAWGHGGEVLWDITTYNTYWINGDTLINGNTFYKLYDGNAFAVYITTDSLKVYCGEDPGNLRVLFDYGLEAGDSFEFYGPDYPYGTLNQTVNMVDSVMIGGVIRKRIHFQNFECYGSGPLLIEGIGDVHFGGIELNYSYVAWYAILPPCSASIQTVQIFTANVPRGSAIQILHRGFILTPLPVISESTFPGSHYPLLLQCLPPTED